MNSEYKVPVFHISGKMIQSMEPQTLPERQELPAAFFVAVLPCTGKHILNREIMPTQNIALSLFPLLSRKQTACCYIPHIHKVISSLYTDRQLSIHVFYDKLYQMVIPFIIRADNTGGMYDNCL